MATIKEMKERVKQMGAKAGVPSTDRLNVLDLYNLQEKMNALQFKVAMQGGSIGILFDEKSKMLKSISRLTTQVERLKLTIQDLKKGKKQ